MRPLILAAFLGLTLAAAAGAGDRASAAPPQGGLPRLDRSSAGKPMPTTTFTDRQGKRHTLAEFRGKPTIVNLWASWCGPCKAEMPALDRFAARNKGRINVIAVAEDLQGWRAVDKAFAPDRLSALTLYLDQPTALSTAYGAMGLPTTIAYDAKGREVWRVDGPVDWNSVNTAKLFGLAPA